MSSIVTSQRPDRAEIDKWRSKNSKQTEKQLKLHSNCAQVRTKLLYFERSPPWEANWKKAGDMYGQTIDVCAWHNVLTLALASRLVCVLTLVLPWRLTCILTSGMYFWHVLSHQSGMCSHMSCAIWSDFGSDMCPDMCSAIIPATCSDICSDIVFDNDLAFYKVVMLAF